MNKQRLWIVVLALIAGCDPATVVYRTASLLQFPSVDAVEQALRSSPEIDRVERDDPESSRLPTVRFHCSTGKPEDYNFEDVELNDGRSKNIMLSWTVIGGTPEALEVKRVRERLARLYERLHRQFPEIPPLENSHGN